MAHEELKKQWEEDVKVFGKDAYKHWEFYGPDHKWKPCVIKPHWVSEHQYRHKEPPFQPEYFSGLNWREAEKLVGKVVETSRDGEHWGDEKILKDFSHTTNDKFKDINDYVYTYIRTCQKTYQELFHPTIKITVNGKDYELPKPERKAPHEAKQYWYRNAENQIQCTTWAITLLDIDRLNAGNIHLTEARCKAWDDFWREITNA
jgi:hypothetical protein